MKQWMHMLKSNWMCLFDSCQRHTQWSQSEVSDASFVWAYKSRGCCERNAWCSWQVGHSSQTNAFSWNGWAQCKQIYNAQDKPGHWSSAYLSAQFTCHNSFQKSMAQYGYSAEELCLNLYYFFKRSSRRLKRPLKLRNHLVLKSWQCYVMFTVNGCHLFQQCNALSQSRMQLRSCCLKTCQRMAITSARMTSTCLLTGL